MSQDSVIDQLNIKKVLQRAHSPLKSDVYLAEMKGEYFVVKDYSKSSLILRETLCLFMRRREIRTLQKLAGIPGIPAYLGEVGPYAYKMQHIDGSTPTTKTLGTVAGLLDQLQAIIKEMHRAGITHNDTRPDNLIYSHAGQLYLIDFGAVFYRPKTAGVLSKPGHWLFQYLTRTDNSKVARLKAQFRPEELNNEDIRLIEGTEHARKITKFWKKHILPIISPDKHSNKP